jgi:hypothetical protein
MSCKVSIFFSAIGDGWTETYWNSAVDPHTVTQGVTFPLAGLQIPGSLGNLLKTRLALSALSVWIAHIRVSLVGAPFNFSTIDGSNGTSNGTYIIPGGGGIPAATEDLFVDALVEEDGVPAMGLQQHRHQYLRGMPVTIVTPPQSFNAEPTWTGAFSSWVNELTQPVWLLNSRPARSGDTQITGFQGLDDAQSAYLQPVPAGFPAVPSKIVLRGMKFPAGWNGTHTVIAQAALPAGLVGQGGLVAGTALLIQPGRKHYPTEPSWGPNAHGSFQLFTAVAPNIRAAHVVRLSEHKVGRPFGLPVGRRRSV